MGEYRKITIADQQLLNANPDLEEVQAELDDINLQKAISANKLKIEKRKKYL
jgi:hypothetical protein